MAQFIKKLKRKQKLAYKFRFKLTYSALSVTHENDWQPGNLVIRWSRGHRHVVSTAASWTPGAQATEAGIITGNGIFDPPCTVDLLVTLYKDPKFSSFEEKDYKFTLEDEGDGGNKRTLGVFSVNIAQFADMIGSQNEVTMELKPIFNKVQEALLDATIQAEFLKTGKLGDDDMMSTWSAMSEMIEANAPDDENSGATQGFDDSLAQDQDSSLNLDTSLKGSVSSYDLQMNESYFDWLNRTSQGDIINKENENVRFETIRDAKVIGIFFASNTSEPSKTFCTFLDSFTNHLREARPEEFQLLFVSCDFSDAEMLDFMQETGINYPGLKNTSQVAEVLKEKFDISVIPTLVIVQGSNGDLVDRDAKLKVERCVGNDEIDEIYSYWVNGNSYPLKQEPIGLYNMGSSVDGDKAKIISKEEKRKQERLDKERKKREEEEKRRKEKIDKEEKKKVEREEKKKQREKEKQDKRNKRASANPATPLDIDDQISEDIPDDAGVLSTDVSIPVELDDARDDEIKPTLLKLAANPEEKTIPEPTEEIVDIVIKTKEAEKFVKEEPKNPSVFSSKHRSSDNQLKETLKHLNELKVTHDFLQDSNKNLIESKIQLENDKEDLQERLNDTNTIVEEKNEQIVELEQNADTLNKELSDKQSKIETLQYEKLSLKENLDVVRIDNDSIRTEMSQLKIQLMQYETEKKVQEEETQKLNASIQLCGWLYKRGVRGPTGKKWRRRYFDASEGFKLSYYKSSAKGVPQGQIDLQKIVNVVPQAEDKQDKNNSSFNIEVSGRVFELLAYDKIMRDQWINALTFLADYIKKYKMNPEASPLHAADTPTNNQQEVIVTVES